MAEVTAAKRQEKAFRTPERGNEIVIPRLLDCMAKNPLSRITVRPEARSGRYVERPTDATLDKFEQASGLTLPATFREFGAGELAGFYRVYAPLPKRYRFGGRVVYDLAAENEILRPHLGEYDCPGGAADYWVFCTDGGGVMYAWNANEAAKGEYRIYELAHRDEVGKKRGQACLNSTY